MKPLVSALLLAVLPGSARALPDDLHLTATVGTWFPVDVGAQLALETPYRLQIATSVGVMPRPYVQLIDDVMVAAHAYDADTASLVEAALKNSLVWRTQVGWRPFAAWGFFFQASYSLVTLGGDLTGSQAIAAATGRTLPAEASGRLDVDAKSTLHLLGLELGYRWLVLDRLAVQLVLGGLGTFAASTNLALRNASATPRLASAMAPMLRAGEQYLDDTYRSYVFAGYLGLQVGYRFF
jgi:hypothetical protein